MTITCVCADDSWRGSSLDITKLAIRICHSVSPLSEKHSRSHLITGVWATFLVAGIRYLNERNIEDVLAYGLTLLQWEVSFWDADCDEDILSRALWSPDTQHLCLKHWGHSVPPSPGSDWWCRSRATTLDILDGTQLLLLVWIQVFPSVWFCFPFFQLLEAKHCLTTLNEILQK